MDVRSLGASETKLRSQPRSVSLAQCFIALVVERLNNVPAHDRLDLALFILRWFGRVYERAPDVDFLPGDPAFVNRTANLGNRGAQGQTVKLGHPLLGCTRARRNRHAHGGNRGKPEHSDGYGSSHGFDVPRLCGRMKQRRGSAGHRGSGNEVAGQGSWIQVFL
jgi:hypothetical protein